MMHNEQVFINLFKYHTNDKNTSSTVCRIDWHKCPLSILHCLSMYQRCSICCTVNSLVQKTGYKKQQNVLIHLLATLNILSQKAQPFGRSNHCGPPKWSLVHHHMSAHNWRLRNSWWQDFINSSSLTMQPRDLLCAFECFSWHSW